VGRDLPTALKPAEVRILPPQQPARSGPLLSGPGPSAAIATCHSSTFRNSDFRNREVRDADRRRDGRAATPGEALTSIFIVLCGRI
jgi:hypothetical protein